MAVLSCQSIRAARIFTPFSERAVHEPTKMTYGCGPASYDIRLGEDVVIIESTVRLASSYERFDMPHNVCGVVHDKSSLARSGVLVQNTYIDPGWRGFLTLELSFHPIMWHDDLVLAPQSRRFTLKRGAPIAQIVFHLLDQATEAPYSGRYQDQEAGPQSARIDLPDRLANRGEGGTSDGDRKLPDDGEDAE